MNAEALDYLRRHSGLSLSTDGVFYFHGEIVPNTRVQALFHAGLEVRADGDVTLTVGSQWAYVACDGVARFIDSVGVSDEGLVLTVRGRGRSVNSDPILGVGPDERFYLWEGESGLPAVLTRTAHQQLAGLLSESVAGQLILMLAGREVPVITLRRNPRAHEVFNNP